MGNIIKRNKKNDPLKANKLKKKSKKKIVPEVSILAIEEPKQVYPHLNHYEEILSKLDVTGLDDDLEEPQIDNVLFKPIITEPEEKNEFKYSNNPFFKYKNLEKPQNDVVSKPKPSQTHEENKDFKYAVPSSNKIHPSYGYKNLEKPQNNTLVIKQYNAPAEKKEFKFKPVTSNNKVYPSFGHYEYPSDSQENNFFIKPKPHPVPEEKEELIPKPLAPSNKLNEKKEFKSILKPPSINKTYPLIQENNFFIEPKSHSEPEETKEFKSAPYSNKIHPLGPSSSLKQDNPFISALSPIAKKQAAPKPKTLVNNFLEEEEKLPFDLPKEKPQPPQFFTFDTEEIIQSQHKRKNSFVGEIFSTPKSKSNMLAPGEEIIIMCKLEEIVQEFFKDYVIVWHDPNVESEQNQFYKAQLERFCEVQTFTGWETASKYIKEAKAICHVLTSGSNGELLVKEISSSQSVLKIYVFCGNKGYHETWAKNYSKVSCIEVQIKDVIYQIEQNLLKWYKEASSLRTNLPAFASIFNNWDKSKMNKLHHYLKVLPNFKNRSQAKNDFITLSKAIYPPDEKNIKDFEKNYNEYQKTKILRWYTHESFLYKITNNCLRIATSDSIQYCRLLLRDLEQAIKEQYQEKSKNFNGLLYRGAFLSQEEWIDLKANLGLEVEMHGFLSVSKDKEVALRFLQENSNQKAFITILVPKGLNEEEQGFAEVEEFSKYPEEKEILFNVRSRFTVLQAEDQGPYRHLVLLYGAQGFRKYISENNPVQEISVPNANDIICSICQTSSQKNLFKPINADLINEDIYLCLGCLPNFLHGNKVPFLCVPKGSETYQTTIKGLMMQYPAELEILFYGYKCCECQEVKQKMYFKCTECQERKDVWCENCFGSGLSGCIKQQHAVILESNPFSFWFERMSEKEFDHLKLQRKIAVNDDVFQQAEMFFRCHQYQKSIKYYNLYLQQNEKNGDKSQIATCYNNLGAVYESQGAFKRALEYFFKSLNLRESIYGENHTDIAASYNNMGRVYNSQGDYKEAITCHFTALKIQEAVGGDNYYHDLANSENNIALVYHNEGKYQEALKYHMSAFEKRKLIYAENHPELACSYNNIGLVYTCQGEFKKALEYHSKALEIQKLVYGDNHPDVATSHINIGNANMSQGEHLKALEDYSKALEIFKSIYTANHLSVAGSYNNIGLVYTAMESHEKALAYYEEALKIRLEILHKDHPDIATSYCNIGGAYCSQGKWESALECLWKAREIRVAVYGENHAQTISTNHQIENIVNNC